MKKAFVIILAAVALVSCNKEIPDNNLEKIITPVAEIVFNLSANHPDGSATKSVKTGWETDDVIFVFFSGQAAPKYLEMKWNGTTWVSTPKNSLALAESETGTMRAVYLPFGSGAQVTAEGTAFMFAPKYYTYYLTATLPYTVTGGTVSGTFDMQIPGGYVQFFLDDASASPATEMELREPHLTPQGIASIAADGTITHTSVASGAPLDGYVYDKEVKAAGESKGYLFSGILADVARNSSTDYHFTLVSGGWQGTYYQKAFSGKTWYRSATEGRALKMPALGEWTTVTDYKPIDLGTDVGGKRIYWASRNVGATADVPAEDSNLSRQTTFGDYFAWGEVTPYYTADPYGTPTWADGKTNGYSWSSYFDTKDGGSSFTKYTKDTKTVLEPAEDAATQNVKVGGNTWIWRMPTYEEWENLVGDKSNWAWDAINKGYTVTSKDDVAGTKPTIFLPAAGNRTSTYIFGMCGSGHYWSSSLSLYYSNQARDKNFDSDGIYWSNVYRYYGYSVRPVTE